MSSRLEGGKGLVAVRFGIPHPRYWGRVCGGQPQTFSFSASGVGHTFLCHLLLGNLALLGRYAWVPREQHPWLRLPLCPRSTFCSSERVLYLPKLFAEPPGSFERVKGSWVWTSKQEMSLRRMFFCHLRVSRQSPLLPSLWQRGHEHPALGWLEIGAQPWIWRDDEQRGRTTEGMVAGCGPKPAAPGSFLAPCDSALTVFSAACALFLFFFLSSPGFLWILWGHCVSVQQIPFLGRWARVHSCCL